MPNFSGKKILVVDDSPDNLLLIEIYLRETQSELTLSHDGLEAFELCKKNQYDLILMDIQMPKMNGYEATEAIRKMGQMMPIIALTAHANKIEHDKCIKAGCDEVLIKPPNKTTFIQTLHRYLEKNV